MDIASKSKGEATSPLTGGTRVTPRGVEFALFSRHATNVTLCVFDAAGEREIARHRLARDEGDVWRLTLPTATAGLVYGYRVDGPFDPDQGHRFNANKLLVDPFARALTGPVQKHPALFGYQPGGAAGDLGFSTEDSAPYVPKAVVTAPSAAGDPVKRPLTPLAESIIYELHVGGFSRRHPGLAEGLRGTFSALTSEPLLGHIKELGITAVELMPVHAFCDEPHLWKRGLSNYWGYNSFNFFTPHTRFGSPAAFREMVQRFHAAGIEVILDVVYNHTAEGDEFGPTLSYRGIDNASYYRLQPGHKRLYVNDTGCGNTLAVEHPYVRDMVLASLRYWAEEMRVDGFRFDLAPTLARDAAGYSADSAFFKAVADDPILGGVKLIAEPWDVGPGGYRLGEFPLHWSEWNDQYRDTVRAFWRGDDSIIGALADRITGSRKVFRHHGRRPQAAINYIAVHDGFTLEDVVCYNDKRNEANHERNRDGHNHNLSRNWGVEGPSDDPAIRRLRDRQKRNMLATLFLSQGVPMLQAGDELGRTQQGNNNSYCQDNELSWIDWQHADAALADFVRRLILLRRSFPQLRRHGFLAGSALLKGCAADIVWFSPEGRQMRPQDWQLHYARCFGFYLGACVPPGSRPASPLLVLMNAHHEPIEFRMPRPLYAAEWDCLIDTAEVHHERSSIAAGQVIALAAHSLLVLGGRIDETAEAAEIAAHRYGVIDLAEAVGIEQVYEDLSGIKHQLSGDTAKLFLEQFGFDVSSEAVIDRQARDLISSKWHELIAPVTVLRFDREAEGGNAAAGYTGECRLYLPENLMVARLNWLIALEDGSSIGGSAEVERLPLLRSTRLDRCMYHELTLPLPMGLPYGYHDLEIVVGNKEAVSRLIVAPLHCYRPDWLRAGERVFGIAHQLYSLRRDPDTGIGDFSDLARLVEHAGKAGADVVGLNPLHALFPLRPGHASPYAPSSRLWLNTMFLDVSRMDGYAGERTIGDSARAVENGTLVDYTDVSKRKLALFRTLYERFRDTGPAARKEAFARFREERGASLAGFATFCALDAHFDGQFPQQWPAAYQSPGSPQVAQFVRDRADEVAFHAWLQWQADEQLKRADDACATAGLKVGLYGDLAVGVASDGADAWADPDIFMRRVSFGAPPDAFNADGQNWCMPPMNPRLMARAGYRPFIDMLRENMRHYGALRMDHVMWLQRMFVIPGGEHASKGTYLRFPFEDLLAILALESTRAQCLVIGEDLGTVPVGFRERMELETILSYRLMRFERHYDGSFKRPQEYPYLALATPSSHDLPTLIGFFTGLDLEIGREIGLIRDDEALLAARRSRRQDCVALIEGLIAQGVIDRARDWNQYAERPELLEPLAEAVQVYLAHSKAALMMLNLEDLAGSPHQVNVPGTVNEVPNWRRRLDFDAAKLATDAKLGALFARVKAARQRTTS
jgi:glycogen operon protein